MLIIYVAHKFSGNLENADKAEHWTAWLNEHIDGAVFDCPWLPQVRYWVDSGESRERGMRINLECVKRFDALIAIGPVSPGMQIELDAAREKLRVFDPMPVAWSPDDVENIQSWVDSIITRDPTEAEADALGRMIAKFLALYYQAKESPTRDEGELLEMKVALDAMRDYRRKSERAEMCDDISIIAQEWSEQYDIQDQDTGDYFMKRVCDVFGTTYGGDS